MCHREGGGTEVVVLWNAPSTPRILDLSSLPTALQQPSDGKHRIWEVFSLSGPPHPPRGWLVIHYWVAVILVEQGCIRLGKSRRERERTFCPGGLALPTPLLSLFYTENL